ncbi:MAG: tetratricopeptide repeat protein [Planctomycetota bacterium]
MRLVRWLSVLTLPALALRIVYLLEIRKVLFFDHPVLDALEYVRWGREVAAGQLLWTELRIHGPLYPFFLGAVFAISPDNYLLVGILQSIVGVASAWIAAMIARELIDGLIAPIVAFCCIAFGWIFVYYDGQWMPTTFIVFFDLLGAWMTLKAWGEGAKYRHALGAGLAFAASALAWGPGIAFLPVAALCIAFTRPPALVAYKRAGACLLAGGALLAPVLARNHYVSGQWTLTQGNAGLNFYIGNNPDADGLPSVRPGLEWESLTQRGLRRDLLADGVTFWMEQPAVAARLFGRKSCLLVANPEVCPSQDIGYFREASRALSLPWPSSGVLLPLGVVGLLVALGRPAGRRVVALSTPVLTLPVVFTVCARYRLPFEALSAPLAGLFVAWISCGGGRFALRALAGGAAALIAILSFADPMGAGTARIFRTHDYVARELFYGGRYEEALDEVQLQRDVDPRDVEVLYDEAVIRLALGQHLDARFWQRQGVDARTSGYAFWTVVRGAAEHFLRQGRPGLALGAIRLSMGGERPLEDDYRYIARRLALKSPVLCGLTGEALRQLGRLVEAIECLRLATSYKPPITDAWVSLGAALGQKGEFAEAAKVTEEATRLAPENAQAWFNLASAYHFLGRKDDAIRAATRARDLGHAEAEKLLRVLRR